MKRGEKKKPDHSSCPVQRKTIGKWNSLSILKMESRSIHYMPNSKSGRGSFRHFYFSYFTFHFYMYKETMGFKRLSEERCDGGDITTITL